MARAGTKHCCKRGEPRAFLEALVGHEGHDCILWPYSVGTSGYGYTYVTKKYISSSRLMCILAHGEPYLIWNEAAHSCGNRLCVNPNHLSWKNKVGNAADRVRHGTHQRGSNAPRAKLTEAQALDILRSTEAPRIMAARYGIDPRTVHHIRSGRRWGHLRWSDEAKDAA